MRGVRFAVLFSFLSLSWLCVSAQTGATPTPSPAPTIDEARAKLLQQSLDDIIAGTTTLRLPENRAFAYAMLGDMYWQFDAKRGRDLFRNAASELSSYNADAEKDLADARGRPGGFGDAMSFAMDPRYTVIPLIAKHDASMALQIMRQTRRQAIADAMVATNTQQGRGPMAFNGTSYVGLQENALEQQVASLAADQDPDLAAKLIKDSIANGVTPAVLSLLQKLNRLDDKKAADLGADALQKMLDTDMGKAQDQLRMGILFLQYATGNNQAADAQKKQFNFTDAQQRQLADKLISTLMAMPASPSPNQWFTQVLPLIDKVEPERSAALKQRQAELQATATTSGRGQQRQNFFGPNVTPEQIIGQLPTLSENDKIVAYSALQNKIGSITDTEQVRKLISQIPDDKQRAAMEQTVNTANAAREIQAGKLEDARRQISQMSDRRQQLSSYVSLAIAYNRSGAEADVATAKSILKDARALTSPFPDTGDDLADTMELVRGYAVIEPDTAFKMIEPGIDMMNEYVQASAVLSKYNRDRSFRNGELIFRSGAQGGMLMFRYLPQVQMLGKADLARANQLIDRFSRPDARMILRLYVLQGAMPTSTQPAGSPAFMVRNQ